MTRRARALIVVAVVSIAILGASTSTAQQAAPNPPAAVVPAATPTPTAATLASIVVTDEMGHYVLHHVWKGLAFALAMLLVAFWLAQRLVEGATRRWGRSWGFEVAHDPAAVPLLLLVIGVFFFLASPLVNGVSRYFEHEADTFALELTHLNEAGTRVFVKFAQDSKMLPDPSPFIRFWRYSHPTPAERILFCTTYKPWEKGEPTRAWHGGGTS